MTDNEIIKALECCSSKGKNKIIADFLLASGVIVSPCKMGRMTFLSKINYKQYTHRPAPLWGGAVKL